MADKKISALTGASTPLAGTEVLPIVQSGATVKVSIADVTAGRAVAAASVTTGAGTAGAPTYSFASDANTGVFSEAGDTISFSTGGTARARINGSGNLGVGGAPLNRLDVSGSSANQASALGAADISTVNVINTANSATGQKASVVLNSNSSSAAVIAGYFETFFGAGDTSTGLILATQANLAGGVEERIRITAAGRVGVNNSSPSAAAQLDVTSTTGGFLPPRMTEAQRDAISTPPDGLMLYNSTTNKLQVRAAGSWVDLH